MKKIQLTNNQLKIIAIVTMVIDHIGVYFSNHLSYEVYMILRLIGRISMPIFAFLIVQGFLNTKNLKKYILKLLIIAIFTQVIIILLSFIDRSSYNLYIDDYLNILFSYVLSLIILWIVREWRIKKISFDKNNILKFLVLSIIIFIYFLVPIDYSINVPILINLFYFTEIFRQKLYLQFAPYIKDNLCRVKKGIEIIYIILILISLLIVSKSLDNQLSWFMIISFIPICLYNGKRGINNKLLNWFFYIFFPVHHIILYLFVLILI